MDQSLEYKRHTLAHLLAAAILKKYPYAKRTIGPAIDTGFYFDFDFSGGDVPNETDLKEIQKDMRKLLPTWTEFSHKEVTADEARDFFKDNQYKIELINEFAGEGQTITFYTAGEYTDLCRGGHAENPSKEIESDSFVLDRLAGAYWRGDEKNPMLTRIYGLAFNTKEELDSYTAQREEALKRDHRKIGKELGLFVFSELVGAGLPLWTPKGTVLRELLNDYVWELRKKKGFQKVTIPHITKGDLYKTSGHWAKYADDLFKIRTREDHEYAMKPMNCPHHTQIFDSSMHSYRDMPERYAETTMVYRDEQSGELSGLTRVLSITQDDAHIFCREVQMKDEANAVWDIISTFYGTFGFSLTPRFSRRDPKTPEKYMGEMAVWDRAENTIKEILTEHGAEWIDGPGEAAFYGPKIDFMAKDSIGRTWQVATIQLDFVQPQNFKLSCINEKGEKEPVVMIHCAIMGSIERFLATYIEHSAGAFPAWLAPTQVMLLPVSEKHFEYAKEIQKTLGALDIRVAVDVANESLGKKIRNAKKDKVPYLLIVGDKETEDQTVTIESRDRGNEGAVALDTFINTLTTEISTKA